MKSKFLSLMILILLTLSACSEEMNNDKGLIKVDIQGEFITKIENEKILVVSNIPQDFSSSGGVKEYYNATWLYNVESSDLKTLKIGQKVEYTTKGLTMTTYPGSVELDEIKIVKMKSPTTTNLTVEEVIREAINRSPQIEVFILKDLTFDEDRQKWLVQFMDGLEKESKKMNLEINDH
ncbi:DUF3221 domain-containing protein [Chengkuizengella marina]|uniref:DUF3221 domain-containing protein n=1 Tax=Chengkuizengella marina TaxID=2507566 RepID=A0A6N9PZQ9_9BACL|nr:DUF3221 domain-containing protein [Chengkuizengella marina]NBI28991.1 DUF3221 domain-containing protein [Chengkuizengella marina]